MEKIKFHKWPENDNFSHTPHDFLWGQGLLVLFEKLTTITSLVSTRRLIAVPVANISMTNICLTDEMYLLPLLSPKGLI